MSPLHNTLFQYRVISGELANSNRKVFCFLHIELCQRHPALKTRTFERDHICGINSCITCLFQFTKATVCPFMVYSINLGYCFSYMNFGLRLYCFISYDRRQLLLFCIILLMSSSFVFLYYRYNFHFVDINMNFSLKSIVFF